MLSYLTGFLFLMMFPFSGNTPVWENSGSVCKWEYYKRTEPGKSVTFIMGEDLNGKNYYQLASDYYTFHPEESTDLVISNCRTIGNVIDFLNQSAHRGCQPWSEINIIAHGNPNTGLNLQITEGGFKATPRMLIQELLLNNLPSIEKGIIGSCTKVNIWSCGVGENPLINKAMQKIFCSESGDKAQVYCSPHFVIFHPFAGYDFPSRLSSSFWQFYHKRGYRPGNLEIAKAFGHQFPRAEIDWMSSLNRKVEEEPDSLCHGQYHIPVSYTRIYAQKEDRPELKSEEEKEAWALNQSAIQEQITDTGIQADKFQWTVHKIIHTREDGSRVPAIKAIGMATVLFVLKPEGA